MKLLHDVRARRMWDWTDGLNGYCGETTFQMALHHFGCSTSAETVHRAAGNRELLIGVNDTRAADNLLLKYEVFKPQQPQQSLLAVEFASFVKRHIDRGALIAVGVYCVLSKSLSGEGDDDYDHIVPIIGYDDQSGGNYCFYDLWKIDDGVSKSSSSTSSARRLLPALDLKTRKECYSNDYPSTKAARTRKEMQQPFEYFLPKKKIYAIALTGLRDDLLLLPSPLSVLPRCSVQPPYLEEPDLRRARGVTSPVEMSALVQVRWSEDVWHDYIQPTVAAAVREVALVTERHQPQQSPQRHPLIPGGEFSVVAAHGFDSAKALVVLLRRAMMMKEGKMTTLLDDDDVDDVDQQRTRQQNPLLLKSRVIAHVVVPPEVTLQAAANNKLCITEVPVSLIVNDTVFFFCIPRALEARVAPLLAKPGTSLQWLASGPTDFGFESGSEEDEEEEEDDDDE